MDAATQLDGFIAKFTPEVAALAKAILAKLQKRYPTAMQMVYDNYNFLVIGFGPTERPSEAIFSLALFARGATLCFLQAGPKIPDPQKLLRGTGKRVRNMRLESAAALDRPEVKALLQQAIQLAKIPFAASTQGKLIIKSISVKQRPRRPA